MPTDSLADPLFERLRRSFPADRAYTSADWDAETMPSPVRHYLDHLLHHYGQQEADRLRRARTDRVDYDHPETDQAARTFFDAIKNHAQVPADQWAETLRTATRRTTSYLVRPVPTLTSFVFEEASGALPVSQVRGRMQFFGPYAYLRDAVQAFAKKRDRETLEPDPFEQVLRRVDEGMTADFDADRWLRLLDPLFETAHRATDRRQIPRSLLHTFFEEKNASHIVERLATHEREEGDGALSPEALRSLIAAAPTESSSERPDVPEPPLDPDFPDAPSATPVQSTESSADEGADEAAPMWKQFEQHISRQSGETDAAEDDESQPLWAQFQKRKSPSGSATGPAHSSSAPPSRSASEDTSTPSPPNDLAALERDVFGTTNPPNRSVYVEKLFQGDEDAYRRALERLRTIETWGEASQVIAKEVFRAHQVNIYSDAAVHFTNAVEAAFKET
jgi:hypothetical protein